jgi:hypothetical protein
MTNYKLYRFSIKPITLSRETMCLRKSASLNYICIILRTNYSPQPAKLFLPNFKANIIHIIIKKNSLCPNCTCIYGSDYSSQIFFNNSMLKNICFKSIYLRNCFYTQIEYLYLRNTFSSIN